MAQYDACNLNYTTLCDIIPDNQHVYAHGTDIIIFIMIIMLMIQLLNFTMNIIRFMKGR